MAPRTQSGGRPAAAAEPARAPPFLVLGADTVFAPGDVARFAAAAAGADGALAVRRDPPPTPGHRGAVRIEADRVRRVLDDDPENPLAAAPLWLLGPTL